MPRELALRCFEIHVAVEERHAILLFLQQLGLAGRPRAATRVRQARWRHSVVC